MRPHLRLVAAIAIAATVGCSSPEKNPPPGPPEITTAAALPHAYKGLAFSFQLAATVAQPPLAWSFAAAPPASLSWLSISTDGVLSGTPPDVVTGESVTIRATDAGGQSTDKTFTVVVDLCQDGDVGSCSIASGDACLVGTAVCASGAFGSCSGNPSTDAAHCGASCTGCGANADSCSAGTTCQCGSGAPCAGTNATSATCSGGTCVNVCSALWGDCDSNAQNGCETPLNTLTNCGGCSNPCTAPSYGYATCGAGNCVKTCQTGRTLSGSTCVCNVTGYTDCGGGTCTTLSSDRYNCGWCGHVCTTVISNSHATCSAGTCDWSCNSGYQLCNGYCVLVGDCVPTCFVAGTPVTMADGSTKAIEAIAAGDRVLAMDVDTRTLTAAVVAHPIAHPTAPALLRINGTLTTTPEHRFFVAGKWLPAIELRIGDALVLAQPGSAGFSLGSEVVTQLELLDGGVPTYNLEVEGLHDYFAGGVLVHNIKNPP